MRSLIAAVLLLWSFGAEAEVCRASWYGAESGSTTASGEPFHPDGLTCARPSFRAGHKPYRVKVTNLSNGRSVVCRVNDRGPADRLGRCIDLSRGAAARLGMIRVGVANVTIEEIR